MRKIMIGLLLVMSMALPVFAQESTEAPTQEVATLEATQTADVITATPSPTDEPTVTPAPTETPVPVPPVEPIDQTKILETVLNLVIVLVVGIIAIASVGIAVAFFGLPPWAQRLVLSTAKTVVDEVDKVTDNPIADAGLASVREYIAKLERELNELKAQVNQNSSDIAYSARQAGNPPMGTGSSG